MRIAAPLAFTAFLSMSVVHGQTTLTTSANPSVFGQPVTLTAAVPAAATGKVTFLDGSAIMGVAAVSAGQATLTTSLLAAGARSLRAFYGGDAGNAATISASLTQT